MIFTSKLKATDATCAMPALHVAKSTDAPAAASDAHRAQHHNASEAPAMMGCSPYKTRAQLVREMATGIGQ